MGGAENDLRQVVRVAMAKRFIHSEPPSRLAIWARRVAGFAFAATFLAVLIVRSGMLEIKPALATFAGALAIAVMALLLALAALAVIWMEGLAGLRAALGAIAISFILLAYPAYLGIRAYRLPWIYDITTDPIYSPRYEALARARPRDANPVAYAGLYAHEQQHAAYPDIEPLDEDATPEAAYSAALAVITKHKWTILDRRPPQAATRREGHIEAVAHSLVMGFADDIVVRVRGGPDGSRIDVRSSSRYGSFDFGSNAARVIGLINDIDDTIGNQKPEPVVLPPPKKPPQPPKRDQPATSKR
jgi:uncharacterized protein (DUF1499 family)